jgi:CDP-4-dehydro-6-deoxyglucose reductase
MKATLLDTKQLTPDVRHFIFEASEVETLHFLPGQFASLTQTIQGKEITRAYSFASAPGDGNRFELCLNHVPDGQFSEWLFELKPGGAVEMRPPMGTFTLHHPEREAVFVATGTGIAPFRSMLQAHLNESSPAITLVFGTRYERSLLYRAEFEEMARRYPQFHFLPVLSRPEPEWGGLKGRVQEHLRDAVGERRDMDVYLCGLNEMVNETRTMLKEMGFDRKHIFYEKYD